MKWLACVAEYQLWLKTWPYTHFVMPSRAPALHQPGPKVHLIPSLVHQWPPLMLPGKQQTIWLTILRLLQHRFWPSCLISKCTYCLHTCRCMYMHTHICIHLHTYSYTSVHILCVSLSCMYCSHLLSLCHIHAVLPKGRFKMYPMIPQISCCIWSAFEELVYTYTSIVNCI